MVWLFWLSLAFLIYTLFGYPLLLALLSRLTGKLHSRAPIWPRVSVIIAGHNAAEDIEQKINNTLALRYPKDKWEIIVASDGSTDATADLVRKFSHVGVRLIEIPERRGKHSAQMVARDASWGEILVFTDVGVGLEPDALEKIVSNFADPSVGCVSSEDRITLGGNINLAEPAYVDFEFRLRRMESKVKSLVSASGSFFAARREVCDVWHPDQSSDFFVPLHTVARGLRAVVDPESIGFYGLVSSTQAEFPRKVRTIVHGLVVFFSHLELLNPVQYGFFSLQLLSHKLFRWLVPFAAFGLLVSNLFLWDSGIFYRVCVVGQAAFYSMALAGRLSSRLSRARPFRLAGFFVMGNLATLNAFFSYFGGERFVTWSPTRRN